MDLLNTIDAPFDRRRDVVTDTTVCVATYGDVTWDVRGEQAAAHARLTLPRFVPVLHHHGDTLHGARNALLDRVDTTWIIYLDADDELEPGYLISLATGTADVRAPSVRYVEPGGRAHHPYLPRVVGHRHACGADCLRYGNWIVVGALARAELLRRVGGWRDYPIYEDWDLWLRCALAGATVEAIPWAVYRALVRHDSRNRSPDPATKLDVHRAIARANGVPIP